MMPSRRSMREARLRNRRRSGLCEPRGDGSNRFCRPTYQGAGARRQAFNDRQKTIDELKERLGMWKAAAVTDHPVPQQLTLADLAIEFAMRWSDAETEKEARYAKNLTGRFGYWLSMASEEAVADLHDQLKADTDRWDSEIEEEAA
jgi:hypothetical protein